MRLRACALVVGLTGLAMLRSVHATDDPVDDGLLEFLGSVDSEDKDWHEYLAGTDIDQVARRAGTATGGPGATAPRAPPPVSRPSGAPPPSVPPGLNAPPDADAPPVGQP